MTSNLSCYSCHTGRSPGHRYVQCLHLSAWHPRVNLAAEAFYFTYTHGKYDEKLGMKCEHFRRGAPQTWSHQTFQKSCAVAENSPEVWQSHGRHPGSTSGNLPAMSLPHLVGGLPFWQGFLFSPSGCLTWRVCIIFCLHIYLKTRRAAFAGGWI